MKKQTKIGLLNSSVGEYVLISILRDVICDNRVTFETTKNGLYVIMDNVCLCFLTKSMIVTILRVYDFDICDVLRPLYREILKKSRAAKN